MDNRPIGVFDSGLGGISLLRNMRALLPREAFIYYGDETNAPYGTKSEEEILSLSRRDVAFLLDFDVKAVVIACNTATSAAAKTLRAEMSLPIIGIEPALKPAQLERREGAIAVLATPATLRQRKFRDLMQLYGEGAISVPCPGLMEFAERGELTGERLRMYLSRLFQPYTNAKVEAVVLGCTHYIFLKRAFGAFFPGVPLIDGNEGTVRQLIRRLKESDLLAPQDAQGGVELLSSGNGEALQTMRRLLDMRETNAGKA